MLKVDLKLLHRGLEIVIPNIYIYISYEPVFQSSAIGFMRKKEKYERDHLVHHTHQLFQVSRLRQTLFP